MRSQIGLFCFNDSPFEENKESVWSLFALMTLPPGEMKSHIGLFYANDSPIGEKKESDESFFVF